MIDVAFIKPGTSEKDLRAFLAGFDGVVDTPLAPIQPGDLLAHLLARAGLFPSVGEARRNGWARPIPPGFSQHRVGRRGVVTILNLETEGEAGNIPPS